MKDRPESASTDELQVTLRVSRLPKDGMPLHVEADERARASIARRFDLVAVAAFEADLQVERWQGEGVVVAGTLRAAVVQTDVVTLDPVAQTVEEEVRLLFVSEQSGLATPADADADEIDVDPGDDLPEVYRGDRVDLGEPLVQLFGLALDPYPRSTGVAFEAVREGEEEPSPFAVLGKLRDKTD